MSKTSATWMGSGQYDAMALPIRHHSAATSSSSHLRKSCATITTAAAAAVIMMSVVVMYVELLAVPEPAPASRVLHQSKMSKDGQVGSVSTLASVLATASGAGRSLQEDTTGTPLAYETQLHLFMCNAASGGSSPTADEVEEVHVVNALTRMAGLGTVTANDVEVSISGGEDAGDPVAFKCATSDMLQWHATITFAENAAAAQDTTPAVLAARANDYVYHSNTEFTELLAANVRDEYELGDSTSGALHLRAIDIEVPLVGWTVTFPSDEAEATQQEEDGGGSSRSSSLSSRILSGIDGGVGQWAWWVWVLYAVLAAFCVAPLGYMACRSRREKTSTGGAELPGVQKVEHEEILDEIDNAELGVAEVGTPKVIFYTRGDDDEGSVMEGRYASDARASQPLPTTGTEAGQAGEATVVRRQEGAEGLQQPQTPEANETYLRPRLSYSSSGVTPERCHTGDSRQEGV